MKKVVIVGGGFAGVKAAIALQKSKKVNVTLISDRDFLYLFPISIWLPFRTIKDDKARISLERISKKHGFSLVIDKVTQIRASQRQVVCENSTHAYDFLMVAFGADKMQMQGMAENTCTICGKPEQTIEVRDKLEALVAKGKGKIAIGFGGNPKDKSAVRGGPAFEFAFNLDHYLRKKGVRNHFDISFFAPMEQPGARMGKKALAATHKMMQSKGIEERFGKKITAFSPEGVSFEDGSRLDADLIMYISAGTGSSILKNSDLPLSEAGFVQINDHCQVNTFPEVFAIGDAASLDGPEWKAKQGHLAEVMADVAAYNILQIINNKPQRRGYQNKISILCIMDMGNGAAIVYRDKKREWMAPLPIVGHWLKQAWGKYATFTKI